MQKKDAEAMACALEQTGNYKVLRRLEPRGEAAEDGTSTAIGLCLDLETTGLDPDNDTVIEVSMVPFAFTQAGHIVGTRPAFDRLQDPLRPIPTNVTKMTGITDAMVRGQRIDLAEIDVFIDNAQLIIAHHANFDRRFAEKLHPGFANVAWACSMSEVPWLSHGYDGLKLRYLLASAGLFHDGHRGLADCHAAIELLARPLSDTGLTALAHVLEASRRTTWRLRATGAPFAAKDLLRTRGYRWNPGSDGRPRAWFIDCDEAEVEAETTFLQTEVFDANWTPNLSPITALNRFSDRI